VVDGSPEHQNQQLLTLAELCQQTRLSPATIHRLKRRGVIPFVQPGGRGGHLRFPADVVVQLIQLPTTTTSNDSTGATTRKPLSGPPPKWRRGQPS
jgi:excisionase family DNA binding protein